MSGFLSFALAGSANFIRAINDKMNVLHVIPGLPPHHGGPSRSVPALCRALTESGTKVSLYATHIQDTPLTVDPVREPFDVRLFPTKVKRLRFGAANQMYKNIRLQSGKFDLIHIHSLWNSVTTAAAAAARQTGIPYIIAPRGMLDKVCLQRHYALKRLYASTVDRRTIEGAARLHFLNEAEAKNSRSDWFRTPKHFIAPNGIDQNLPVVEPGSFRRRFSDLKNRRIMLFLGRLHPIKGLDLQLQALSILVGKYADLLWVLVGPDDGEWQRLQALVQAAGLGTHVKWVGPIMGEERFSALADADVVVQTSFYECHSMAVNEALSVGVPLVITDSIHFDEVQASGAGYVVPRDPVPLANAIDLILQAPDRGELMRAAGRRFAAKHLAWPRIAEALNIVYGEIVSSSQNLSQSKAEIKNVWTRS